MKRLVLLLILSVLWGQGVRTVLSFIDDSNELKNAEKEKQQEEEEHEEFDLEEEYQERGD